MATIALPREETPGHHMIGHSGAEEGWTPAALSRQNCDSYLQNQARISSRGSSTLPAGRSASHTEPGSTTTKGLQTNDSWWDPARRPSILAAASLPHSTAAAVRAIERQGELSSQPPTVLGMADAGAVWPEEPAPEYGNRISGENNIAASSGTNRGLCLQPPTFNEGSRLEAVPKRIIGSFGTASGGDTWRTGEGETSSISGGAAGSCWSQQGGIDAEVATTGLSWSRESGGEDDQRQPESLNTPSQRLSEMKTYFGRQEQVSTSSENEGDQRLSFTSNSGDGGAYRSRLEVAVDNGDFRGEGESHGQINGSGNANGGDNRQADRTSWHGGCSAYPPPAASTSTASTNSANDTSSVGIVDHPSRDGIENGGRRSWNEGAGAAWPVTSTATATAGGDDGGEGGVGVDFDPPTESRNTQSAHVISGDNPASWWKDTPEPVVPTTRWSLQLPNLAPPLAQRHDPTGIRGVLESSAMAGVNPPVFSGLGKLTSQHHRHRNAEPLYNNFSNFDVMDSAGVRYGARTGSGVSSMHGGQKWGTNPPQLTGDAYSGLGFNGVSSSGGGSERYFNSRMDETRRGDTQLFDSVNPSGRHSSFNNGTFHPVDPSGRHPPFNNGSFYPVDPSGRHPSFNNGSFYPVDPSGRHPPFNNGSFHPPFNNGVQASIHPGGADSLSRQDANPTSGTVRGVDLDRRVTKKTRIAKHEDLRMYTDWTGGLNGGESLELRRGSLGGGSEGGTTVEAGMSERSQKGKKIPASSRRCRAEGCKSHPNFGVEGDRRALYCAKHKLPGMVNVKAPRCQHPSCTRNPVYGNAGDPRATYCLSHKSPLMVDVKNRRCQYPNCRHQPSFGVAGDRRANFCFTHKLPSHVNIRRARAKAGETYNTDSNGNQA